MHVFDMTNFVYHHASSLIPINTAVAPSTLSIRNRSNLQTPGIYLV